MTRQRRYRDRQGVVYGQLRPRDGTRGGGMLLGQVLGLIVLVAAVAALGFAALSLLDEDETGVVAGATPSPTSLVSTLTPVTRPTAPRTLPPPPTAAPRFTIIPFASATPTASFGPLPSAGATPFELQVHVGPGYVTFGTQRNSNLLIVDPRTQFANDERILWSAALSEPTDTWLLNSTVYKVDVADGTERLVDERGERARVAGAEFVSSSLVPSERLDGPGVYVMRYTRGAQLLAEGYFRVTVN